MRLIGKVMKPQLDNFMKTKASLLLKLILTCFFIVSCDFYDEIAHKARVINNYEKKSLELAKRNRELSSRITDLEYQVQTLNSKNKFLTIQLDKFQNKKKAERKIASVAPTKILKNDLVKNHIYNWSPSQLLAIGEKELIKKNFEKSAQYFHTYLAMEETHKTVSDDILFQSGIAAYESGKYYDWSKKYFKRIITEYPTSKYYRGAKLWHALASFKQGDTQAFYGTVEEFRKKYKNTPEWDILRGHYEEITLKYKK